MRRGQAAWLEAVTHGACELPLSVVLQSAWATLNKKCDVSEGVASN